MAEEKADFYNFANMHYDLSTVSPSQDVLDVFPELKHIPAYIEASDTEVRAALLICDPKGPFSTIKRYDIRVQAVCRWLKVTPEEALYQELINIRNEKVIKIWTHYLADCFDHEWVSWFSDSLMYYQMHEELRKKIDFTADKDWDRRAKIQARAKIVYENMVKMEEIIFVDDAIKRKSFEAEKSKIENYPEAYAVDVSIL